MKWQTLLVVSPLISVAIFAQDPCSIPGDKKQSEGIEVLLKSKLSLEGKKDQLLELTAEFPENGRLWFEIARLQFLEAEKQEIPDFDLALSNFEKCQDICPDLNPLLDYYLGIIYYSKADYRSSLKSFNNFLLSPKNPWDKDHELKLQDVKESVGVIEQEMKATQRTFSVDEHSQPQKMMRVSTDKSEFLPMLSPDNSLLFFTRKYDRPDRSGVGMREVEEFTSANKLPGKFEFDQGKAMEAPFNKGGNYGGATVSINNKELFITVCVPTESGYKNCDIFETSYVQYRPDPASDRMAYHWTALKNLGPNVNTPATWEAQPSISPDGKTLYFTRYGKETKETDLYFAQRGEQGKWGIAQPFPESINTAGNDKAPFMHQDGKTLYYASTGRGGEGGFDIFMTTKLDSLNWSPPKNIGLPVNTPADEHGMLVSTDGKYAVFATNGGDIGSAPYDLYCVELPGKARPDDIVLIKGKIDSASENTHLQLKNTAGQIIREIQLDKDDGAYATIIHRLEMKEALILGVEQEGAAFEARIIDTTRVVDGTVDNEVMQVNVLTANQAYTIEDINFETNSSVVMESSKLILIEFARFLMKNPSYRVVIQGHTDNVGDKDKNFRLSIDRALSVKNYLISKGVPPSRLEHKGFGDTQAIQSNESSVGRAKNRRTEFLLIQ